MKRGSQRSCATLVVVVCVAGGLVACKGEVVGPPLLSSTNPTISNSVGASHAAGGTELTDGGVNAAGGSIAAGGTVSTGGSVNAYTGGAVAGGTESADAGVNAVAGAKAAGGTVSNGGSVNAYTGGADAGVSTVAGAQAAGGTVSNGGSANAYTGGADAGGAESTDAGVSPFAGAQAAGGTVSTGGSVNAYTGGADAGGTESTDAGASSIGTLQTMENDTSAGWYFNSVLYVQYIDYLPRTQDWDMDRFKGECPRTDFVSPKSGPYNGQAFTNGAIRGLSGDYYEHMMIHGLNCVDQGYPYFDAASFDPLPSVVLTFSTAGSGGPLPITVQYPQGWDWDPNYEKTTCPPNTFVSGVAQNTDGSGIDAVQCANVAQHLARNDNTCSVVTMGVDYNGYNHGSDGNADWDVGYQKGSCNGGAIAGISRNVPEWDPNDGGGLHAILCCGALYTAGAP